MMNRFVMTLVFAAATAVGLTGCRKSAGGNSPAGPSPVTAVRLGYFPNVTHAQAVLGVDRGDFAAAVAPAAFTPRVFNAGPALIEALFAGDIDAGYVGPGPAIRAYSRSHGNGISVISGAAADGVLIVARKGSGIRSMADLKGRIIATPQQNNTQDIAARHYLISVLGQTDTKNVLPIANADQLPALSRGDVDAAWDPEPWGSVLISSGQADLVAGEKDLWPGKEFALTVIVTTPQFYQQHRDVLAKLLKVNRKWTQQLNSDRAGCTPLLEEALKKLNGKALPKGVVADSLAHVKFTEDPSPATFTAEAQWEVDLQLSREALNQANLFAPLSPAP